MPPKRKAMSRISSKGISEGARAAGYRSAVPTAAPRPPLPPPGAMAPVVPGTGFYARLGASATFLSSSDQVTRFEGGSTATERLQSDTGFNLDGALGMQWGPLRLEGQGSYLRNTARSLTRLPTG